MSEPLGDPRRRVERGAESSYGVVQKGQDELRLFAANLLDCAPWAPARARPGARGRACRSRRTSSRCPRTAYGVDETGEHVDEGERRVHEEDQERADQRSGHDCDGPCDHDERAHLQPLQADETPAPAQRTTRGLLLELHDGNEQSPRTASQIAIGTRKTDAEHRDDPDRDRQSSEQADAVERQAVGGADADLATRVDPCDRAGAGRRTRARARSVSTVPIQTPSPTRSRRPRRSGRCRRARSPRRAGTGAR